MSRDILKLVREFGPDVDLPAERPEVVHGSDDGWYECRKCGWVYHIDEVHSTYSHDGERPTCDPDGYPPIHSIAPLNLHFVAVYSVGRAYGGPEEGGWWFDTGELERVFALPSRRLAEAFREELREVYPDTGRSSSVLGGEDWAIHICTDPPVRYFPEKRPHYE